MRVAISRKVEDLVEERLIGCPVMAVREEEEGGIGRRLRKWLTGSPVRLKP